MSVTTSMIDDGRVIAIKVSGRFDFSVHPDFRNAYEHLPNTVAHYIVDLSDASYLDSSALGMLLLLRDHAGGDSASVEIQQCNPDVRKILTISNFDQLFVIS